MRYKTFRLDDIFEKIPTNTLPYKVQQLPKIPNEVFNLPALTAGIENQGLNCFVPRKNATILKHCISVSANGENSGAMFYQPNDFTVLQDSYAIKYKGSKEIEAKAYLYLVSVMQKTIRGNFNWSIKAGWERIRSITIELPVTDTEEIDFEYMETKVEAIKKINMDKIEESLKDMDLHDIQLTPEEEKALTQSVKTANFLLNDICEISYGNKFDKNKMSHINPTVCFVSRTEKNNGISDVVDAIPNKTPHPAGLITLALGGSIGSCFLQEKPFYTGQNVGVLKFPESITREAKLFIISVLSKKCKEAYTTFADEINKHLKTDLSINLPVKKDSNGVIAIDYDYMHNYIRAIEKLAIQRLYDENTSVVPATANDNMIYFKSGIVSATATPPSSQIKERKSSSTCYEETKDGLNE